MTFSEKIKEIDNKIWQSKDQINLDRQTSKISALSARNAAKYQFLIDKDAVPERRLLKKAVTIKIFHYFPFFNELKNQISISAKQYQIFDDDDVIYRQLNMIKNPHLMKYNRLNLIYNRDLNSSEFNEVINLATFLGVKVSHLNELCDCLK